MPLEASTRTMPEQGQNVDRGCASDASLVVDIRAVLPVLPVLTAQLKEVAAQVEQSVVKVCDSFQAMALRAREAAAQVALVHDASARPKGGEGGIGGLISSTRGTLGDLLRQVEQSSAFSSLTVNRMETMEQQVAAVERTLHEIDEVAGKARVLALNGRLEAARAGAQGVAFGVVATETAKMANHAIDSSRVMRERIGEVSQTIASAAEELRDRAEADRRGVSRSHEEVDHALDRMTALHAEMQEVIARSRQNSDQLARDISAAVMAMQFQDAMSQRIEHVVQTLEELHAALSARIDPEGEAAATGTRDWALRMAGQYTMASEHRVLAEHAGQMGTAATECDDNVELF